MHPRALAQRRIGIRPRRPARVRIPAFVHPDHADRSEVVASAASSSLVAALSLFLMLGLLAFLSAAALSMSDPRAHSGRAPGGRLALQTAMRGWWGDEADWTRLVFTAAPDTPELEAATQRMLRDPAEIGEAVKPYYGETAGKELAALLQVHLQGVANVLAAFRAGDEGRLEAAKRAWYGNAAEIATFLSHADPRRFQRSEIEPMLRRPLDLILLGAIDQREGRHFESVSDFDRARREGLRVAEILSNGILEPAPSEL